MARIPYPEPDELDAETAALLAALPPLNLFRMLAGPGCVPLEVQDQGAQALQLLLKSGDLPFQGAAAEKGDPAQYRPEQDKQRKKQVEGKVIHCVWRFLAGS